jgi:hypothetical protein
MMDLLRRHVTTSMITAILLACAIVTAMLWAGLRLATLPTGRLCAWCGDPAQSGATITVPAPPVHAQLMPARGTVGLLPVYLPAHPSKHRR